MFTRRFICLPLFTRACLPNFTLVYMCLLCLLCLLYFCHCLLVMLPMLPMLTYVYTCLPMFTHVYSCMLTYVYPFYSCLPLFATAFSCIFTYFYHCLLLFNYIYSCLNGVCLGFQVHLYLCFPYFLVLMLTLVYSCMFTNIYTFYWCLPMFTHVYL